MGVLVQPVGDDPVRVHGFDGVVGDPDALVGVENLAQFLRGQVSFYLKAFHWDVVGFRRAGVVISEQQTLPGAVEQQAVIGAGVSFQIGHSIAKTFLHRRIGRRVGL